MARAERIHKTEAALREAMHELRSKVFVANERGRHSSRTFCWDAFDSDASSRVIESDKGCVGTLSENLLKVLQTFSAGY
eukprot:COSAG04_NODE_11183_length_725_cov_0.912141_2_plen_78_part_01